MKKPVLDDPKLLTPVLVHSILLLNNRYYRPRRIGRLLHIAPRIVHEVLAHKLVRRGKAE